MNDFTQLVIFKNYYKKICTNKKLLLKFGYFLEDSWNKKQYTLINNADYKSDLEILKSNMKKTLVFWVSQRKLIKYSTFYDNDSDSYIGYSDNESGYYNEYFFNKFKYKFLSCRIIELRKILSEIKIKKSLLKQKKYQIEDEFQDYCLYILYDNTDTYNTPNLKYNFYKKYIPSLKTIYE